jgi:predicted phosphodiesterase
MRTLVIADIHLNTVRAQKVISSVPHDKLVLTGDYFDAYGSTAQETRDTAIWLKENILHNPKAVALMGNHDTSYIFNTNRNFRCSGYREEYNQIVNSILNEEDKAKFGVYHIDQGYVFSHAGLTNELWREYSAKFTEQSATETKIYFFDRVMKVISKEAVDAARSNNDTVLFAAGWDRGGIYRHGGMNWVDWGSFSPIKGINQIVGHSIHRVPQVLVQKVGGGYVKQDVTEHYDLQGKIGSLDKSLDPRYLSVSYDIDTHLNHYAVIEDGVVDIFHIETGINLKDIKNYNIPESEMNGLS